MNLFEAKVKYKAIDQQSGKEKTNNVIFIVDSMSYTECETNLTKELTTFVHDFIITSIKLANYSDLFLGNVGAKYYRCKVEFVTIDESSGKEKKTANYMLVNADSLEEAKKYLDIELKDMTVDYDVSVVQETKIEDVFIYGE